MERYAAVMEAVRAVSAYPVELVPDLPEGTKGFFRRGELILADRGRRVVTLPRSWAPGEAVRNPLSLVPALVARPRAFGEPTIRRDMPAALVSAIDRMDAAGRRRALRAIERAARSSGFEAACEAAEMCCAGGRVADDVSVDLAARRVAAGRALPGGATVLSVYDGLVREWALPDAG